MSIIFTTVTINDTCTTFIAESTQVGLECIKHICDTDNTVKPSFQDLLTKEFTALSVDPMSSIKMLIGGSQTFKIMKTPYTHERFTTFANTYFNELDAAYSAETHVKSLDDTFHRMLTAIVSKSFNKDSVSLKNTCKVLKVKHTYKAIEAYLIGV